MLELQYSLIIEATDEPDFFGFYSPDLEGFTGICHSVEDCLFKAKWGMIEHVNLLKERGLPIPPKNPEPTIIIQNERKLVAASTRQTLQKESTLNELWVYFHERDNGMMEFWNSIIRRSYWFL